MHTDDRPSILQKIILDKQQWIAQKKAHFPLTTFKSNITPSDRSFYQALAKAVSRPAFILECKKASPSKGVIRPDFDLIAITDIYKNYADVISVLTDEKYFQGNFDYLPIVRNNVPQPVLCKDFIIDEYQIYLARYYQADAILLMLSVLDDEKYSQLANIAHQLGMGVLTETANQIELTRAIALNAKVIGINNRNLHTLTVDLNTTPPLAQQIPPDRFIISESGIYSHAQVCALKPYVDGFLIGSSLMKEKVLNDAVRTVLFGENKICGLTRVQDVQAAYQAGALYGGLIFAEQSVRKVSLSQAQELVKQAPLRFVGVFQDQAVTFISQIANQLDLFAVQLHGREEANFITQLRQQLPSHCQIWQTISVNISSQTPIEIIPHHQIDRYVLDSKQADQRGGTGMCFDWSCIPASIKSKAMLAGGIKLTNVEAALNQHCLGLDINSGVEDSPGIKDANKINAMFNLILKK